jgi:hypothetical protein
VKIEKLTSVPAAFEGIAAKVNEVIAAHPPLKAGENVTITQSEEHTLISVDQASINQSIARASFNHPFRVYLTASGTAKILPESRVYTSFKTSEASITNLTTAFSLASNTYVWIQFTVSALAITAISRQTGTAWPSLIVTSGSPAVQTQFNVPVGKVTAANPNAPGFEFSISGTNYHFEQCLFSHLLVEPRLSSTAATIYAFPWSGA